MDDFTINDERIDEALIELKIINKYLGGNSTSKKGVKKVLNNFSLTGSVKIIDAGSGASNILIAINNLRSRLEIFGIDLNLTTCRFVRKNSPGIKIICGNVLKLPLRKNSFDIAHASLFIHHFPEDQIKQILTSLIDSVKYAVIINDLRRSFFAFTGIKILTRLFSTSELVKNDAPLSVKRAFVKRDLVKILEGLNNIHFSIKRTWTFRWLIIIYKTGQPG
jgi:hypothetical protein